MIKVRTIGTAVGLGIWPISPGLASWHPQCGYTISGHTTVPRPPAYR
jgi:hypothetical protein